MISFGNTLDAKSSVYLKKEMFLAEKNSSSKRRHWQNILRSVRNFSRNKVESPLETE
jgi:hypothetical protein